MAGYGAVVSFQQTVERILDSSRISLVSPSRDIVLLAYREINRLREIMLRLDMISPSKSRKKVNALDAQIKQVFWVFEDLLECDLCYQFLSQFEIDSLLFSVDLQSLLPDFNYFIEVVKYMEKNYLFELENMPELEEDELAVSNDFGGVKVKMVGFVDEFENAKRKVMLKGDENYLYSFVGMPGSGKTTIVKSIFEDLEISRWFDHRVWVTVGRKYDLNEIVGCILAQVGVKLEGKKCLIVLDNVWNREVLDYFVSNFPERAVIRILVTTNLVNTTDRLLVSNYTETMRSLNGEESEDLLREKVFGEDVVDFPRRIKKAAKKIALNCKGLPLMIVTVADFLSKANQNDDAEFWNEVAENRNSDVMMEANDQVSKVLFPVYDCSPQFFKMLLLYMGAFPQDYDIPASKLNILLTAEGFLHVEILDEFCIGAKAYPFTSMSGIISEKKSVNSRAIKTCRINSSWCHLFNKEASKDKFLCVLNSSVVDGLEENMKGQRRLCLHTNFLLSFKDVYNSVKCNCASTLRSLLCFGPYHKYPMPLDVGFKLLRVLDALRVRFYDFPIEILKLNLLQYLALSYNGELPTSISKLLNLQFLIIRPHVSIECCGAPSYVPVQIWDMQELKHIEILGRNLPNPNRAVSLPKLSTLVGVGIGSCTREVLERLPNIKKLGIRIELSPGGDVYRSFDHIWKLENLDTLKYIIVNPEVEYGYECVTVAPPTPPVSKFPSSLRKLHLSGLGYPWEYMEVIGSMPNLQVLKLRCYAFQGPKWEIKRKSFLHLEYLLMEDTDLVQWKPRSGSFPKLRTLRVKHCYYLEEIRWPYDADSGSIEILNCHPFIAVSCAEHLKPTDESSKLKVTALFDDKEVVKALNSSLRDAKVSKIEMVKFEDV